MTSTLTSTGGRTGAPFFYAGWAGFALFGAVVYLDGNAGIDYAVIHVVVATALCAWFAKTSGKAAPVVGAVLGTLYFLQMVLFVSSAAFSDDPGPVKTRVEDAAGLVAAVLVLVGARFAIQHRRASGLDPRRGPSYSA